MNIQRFTAPTSREAMAKARRAFGDSPMSSRRRCRPSSWRSQVSLPEWLQARGVVAIAGIDTRKLTRLLRDRGLAEVPSTRLLVATARLVAGGIPIADACRVALLAPLTDDPDLLSGMRDLVSASLA